MLKKCHHFWAAVRPSRHSPGRSQSCSAHSFLYPCSWRLIKANTVITLLSKETLATVKIGKIRLSMAIWATASCCELQLQPKHRKHFCMGGHGAQPKNNQPPKANPSSRLEPKAINITGILSVDIGQCKQLTAWSNRFMPRKWRNSKHEAITQRLNWDNFFESLRRTTSDKMWDNLATQHLQLQRRRPSCFLNQVITRKYLRYLKFSVGPIDNWRAKKQRKLARIMSNLYRGSQKISESLTWSILKHLEASWSNMA